MAASRGQRASTLGALGFGFFIDSAEDLALPMLFPAIRTSLGLGYTALSVIDNIRIIVQTFSGPFWGMAADRFNRKWILVLGTGLWGLWTLVCGLVTNYWQLLVVRVIACIGLGCLYPAAFSMLADVFGPKERGKAMGSISAIGMAGIIVGALVFGELLNIPETGWRYGFIFLGLASALSGLVIAIFVKNPVRGGAEPELQDVITAQAESRFRFRLADVLAVLKSGTIWVNFIQGCFIMTAINALTIFYVTWLVDDRGFSQSDAPIFFAGVVVSLAVGSLVGGLVADWADQRSPNAGRVITSQVSILVSLPAMWYLLRYAHTFGAILTCSLIAGFFLDWTRRGVQQPLAQAVIRPELRSTAMALMEFVQGAFASVVIMLFGQFADAYGLTRTLLVLVVGFWTIALFVTFAFYRVYPPEARRLREEMGERRELLLEKK